MTYSNMKIRNIALLTFLCYQPYPLEDSAKGKQRIMLILNCPPLCSKTFCSCLTDLSFFFITEE